MVMVVGIINGYLMMSQRNCTLSGDFQLKTPGRHTLCTEPLYIALLILIGVVTAFNHQNGPMRPVSEVM